MHLSVETRMVELVQPASDVATMTALVHSATVVPTSTARTFKPQWPPGHNERGLGVAWIVAVAGPAQQPQCVAHRSGRRFKPRTS